MKYKDLCLLCDNILTRSDATKTTVAITWLHVLRRHPDYVRHYLYLFKNKSRFSLIKRKVLLLMRFSLISLKSLFQSITCIQNKTQINKKDALIVSHLTKQGGVSGKEDLYFGSLQDNLESHGLNISTILINHTHSSVIKNNKFTQNTSRIILSKTLSFYSEFKILIQQLIEMRRLNSINSQYLDLQRDVIKGAAVFSLSPETANSLRIAEQIRLLILECQPKCIITTYEGHAWERLVYLTAKEINPNIKCIGYQHSSLFKSQHAIRRSLGPLLDPDIILASGKVYKCDLEDSIGKKGVNIQMLGSSKIANKENIQEYSKVNKTCLVAPEGLISECKILFEFSFDCARLNPDIQFIWRLHPIIDIDNIIKSNKKFKKIPKNITLSINSLEKDIALSDYVIYRGSTVVISAILQGLVPIYIDNGDKQDLDPLYQYSKGKHVVKNSDEFFSAISKNIDSKNLRSLKKYGGSLFAPMDVSDILSILND